MSPVKLRGTNHKGEIMKNCKQLVSLLLCVIIALVSIIAVSAETIYSDGDWDYVMINNYTEFEIDRYNGSSEHVSTVQSHNNLAITSIAKYAFSNNTTVKSVNVNSPIALIGNYAFMNATTLETVIITDKVIRIGAYAFSGCSSLNYINLEDSSITAVNKSSFQNCSNLVEVKLPATVTSIADYAFSKCESLTKIVIPESVVTISDTAFNSSDNVVIYCYENSTAHLFAEENSIEYVLLAPPVTYILGDVDNSGEVSILDATEVQLLIAQLVDPQDEYTQLRADIDCDGVLSIMDATSIQMYIAGYEVDEPIGETFEV